MTVVQVTIAIQQPAAVVTVAPDGAAVTGPPFPAPAGAVLSCTLP